LKRSSNNDVQQSFRALADPTRREILRQLCTNELSISEVVDKFDLTRTAVRKHLNILEQGELITITRHGREQLTSLNPQGLKTAAHWFDYFEEYWDQALASLKDAVERDNNQQAKRKK